MTLGDGGVPGRCSESDACVTMRVNAGSELINASVFAFVSCGAVRNAVLICSKNETRFVVRVNSWMNGCAACSIDLICTKSDFCA